MHHDPIDPQRLYSFSEIRDLVPSSRKGKRVSFDTLHRWRLDGKFSAVCRPSRGKRFWFAWGSEVMKLLGSGPPRPEVVSSSQRQRESEEALEEILGPLRP